MLNEIRKKYQTMFEAEKRVADYILEHPDKVVFMSMAELTVATNTSDATVMRMCRRVDMSGYSQLKMFLASEVFADTEPNTTQFSSDTIVSPTDVVDYMNYLYKKLSHLSTNIDMKSINKTIDLFLHSGTVYAFGWGNTFTIAEDLCHRLLRNGIHSFTSDNMEYMIRSITLAEKSDILVAISHTGRAHYTLEAMKLARQKNLPVILITNSPQSVCSEHADITLCTNLDDDILGTWGNTSHVPELIVIDILLYFLQKQNADSTAGNISETFMARFRFK